MTQLPINAANTAALLDESMDDSLALRRFATQGDPAAFRALTQRYQSMVFATCRRVLRSQADAEDAAQETFLKFARAAATIRGNAAAWLENVRMRAVRNDTRCGRMVGEAAHPNAG